MKKQQKTAIVEDLAQSFGRASIAIVSEFRGMTAGQSTEVRRRIRAASGEMRVAKNSLVRRAIKGTAYEALEEKLGGQIGLFLSYADPVAIAKAFTSFGPLGEKLKLRGAVLDGKPLSIAEVQALATLPPREVVLGQLLGLLNAPATQLVRLLNEPGSYLARVIDAIGKKNGERSAASPSSDAAPVATAAVAEPVAEPPASGSGSTGSEG
jgi:large subunit ribosomal protein L10